MKPLAQTPPMGWNSWNAFEAKIDEAKIFAIADAMVASGMRDAGYRYLVLDDGWLRKERDEKGDLVADPVKFPNGMKAVGDYLHKKGLLFGIYQDRGRLTCQGLAGSYLHEQADMTLFASWGVDYLKLDSCYAEANKRLSSDDYALYRDAIRKTGRPMVLSMSDFGNGAWTWGGEKIGHLWRTSYDIYPDMGSVYSCAETSAGAEVIHPAFNGLGQFAGPGHWNDPDMLQVGNLKDEAQNRTHFALWCILAAPLMAGNDLRSMTESVKTILTAREVIAINQDPRGVQGYRIVKEDGHEIYNKPLADGTTAVLLLNKNATPAPLTVAWEKLGLKGKQRVRDLWLRKDLGSFDGGFTTPRLAQHEHLLVRVGSRGRPLPAPAPLPLERYTVTKSGTTYLSELCYIWKHGHAPVIAAGTKNLSGEGKCAISYKLSGRTARFLATAHLDESTPSSAEGRFRVLEEDFFGNKVLFDSGKLKRDAPPKTIDIDVTGKTCLMLEFTGEKAVGTWADARVVA